MGRAACPRRRQAQHGSDPRLAAQEASPHDDAPPQEGLEPAPPESGLSVSDGSEVSVHHGRHSEALLRCMLWESTAIRKGEGKGVAAGTTGLDSRGLLSVVPGSTPRLAVRRRFKIQLGGNFRSSGRGRRANCGIASFDTPFLPVSTAFEVSPRGGLSCLETPAQVRKTISAIRLPSSPSQSQ